MTNSDKNKKKPLWLVYFILSCGVVAYALGLCALHNEIQQREPTCPGSLSLWKPHGAVIYGVCPVVIL